MSDFRRPSRHRRYSKTSVRRLALMIFVFGAIIFWFAKNWDYFADLDSFDIPQGEIYAPEASMGVVYHKPGFSLSYVEQYELAEWVVYSLSEDMMDKNRFKRDQDFNPDPDIASGSGHYRDYKGSGYRRGHLVPSADMAWDKTSMDATFLLSNVAPMKESFNDGIWLELEHHVRDWARLYKKVTVITGPVFSDPLTAIGDNEILVPRYFFKAVFTADQKTPRVIGFVFDQTLDAFGSLDQYIVSVDSIERFTGLDLFSNLYGSWETEIELEERSSRQTGEWPFNARWSDQRNKRRE